MSSVSGRPARARRRRLHVVLAGAGVCAALAGAPAGVADTPPPLSLGVVIDSRPQQQSVMEFERQAVDALARALAGVEGRSLVVSYSDRVQLVADWSPLGPGLHDAAARIVADAGSGKGRGATLNDGLMDALARLDGAPAGDRRVLVVIGEGSDGGSTTRFDQVLDRARARRVQCFALLVANHRSQVGKVRQFGFNLFRLAAGTGGRAYDVQTSPRRLDDAVKDALGRLSAPAPRIASAAADAVVDEHPAHGQPLHED